MAQEKSVVKIETPTEQLNKPTVIFWIERSKNKNIVVNEGMKNSSNNDHYNDMIGYWLCIEPSYQQENRKKGKQDDREDLSFLEKKMAYGYSVIHDEKSTSSKQYKVQLTAIPKMECTLITDNKDNNPKMITLINKQKCILKKVYVETKESWKGPTVIFVDIYGINMENGNIEHEKLKP